MTGKNISETVHTESGNLIRCALSHQTSDRIWGKIWVAVSVKIKATITSLKP